MNDDASGESSFRAFLEQFEQATRGFINGDPDLWKQHASRRDDVTLMGGWGICEKGWAGVGARYDWAAARFRDSGAALTVEYLASGVSGDLAYTVGIERSVVRLADQSRRRTDGPARDPRVSPRRRRVEARPSPRGSAGQHDGAGGGPAAEMMRWPRVT